MGDVRLTGELVCKDADEAGVVAESLPEHVRLTRSERGCLAFAVSQTPDPLVWRVEEHFESEAAFEAHRRRVASSDWGRVTAGIERRYSIDGLSF
jgi:quinol monooxygenase YgiN